MASNSIPTPDTLMPYSRVLATAQKRKRVARLRHPLLFIHLLEKEEKRGLHEHSTAQCSLLRPAIIARPFSHLRHRFDPVQRLCAHWSYRGEHYERCSRQCAFFRYATLAQLTTLVCDDNPPISKG